MMVIHPRVFTHCIDLEAALLRRNTVNVHGTIATLCCDVLIQRVPCYTLNIVIVFSNLTETFTWVNGQTKPQIKDGMTDRPQC